ncbi:cupin domain-containing protein [Burkholderia thailandensis]|uniref:Cupin type-2 domain-containing protein n=1 Tax=Burkholderia thailandensis TaxID=57975 RepID=A0AAW9CQW4_BURTH|nr:cupin domain-containing protein [Burkholderia thailandensis]AHI67040.1 cupin 2, conserved barrel domain protein [Burkholderia thailandensis H0587]AIP66238.1 cupin [Burkholderia thailandensis]AJY30901.1 cupin domain protein [Burkholderia thailandensis 34]AOI54345.1 cupin [Burkholderia thailandensis]AOJ53327.1 cupin [Burkholderia thailandensis]
MFQAGIGINFEAALRDVTEYWSPRVVGRVNDQYVKVAKLKGEFTWHKHAGEDEMFYVVYGSLRIQFEGRADVVLNAGDFCIVPKNTMHNPVAEAECGIALIETVTTLHTGDTPSPLAKSIDAQLAG